MDKTKQISRLKENLIDLKNKGCVVGLKTGTEIEDMDFDEIGWIKQLSDSVVPMTVKIGGPEARNDIRHCLKLKIDTILAPMIESVYALHNFVQTIDSLAAIYPKYPLRLAANIESFEAVNRFDDMLASSSMQKLSQITIGRTDLSSSMHLTVDDDEVFASASKVVKKSLNRGLLTSLGGKITLQNIGSVARNIPVTRINTRHIVFENNEKFRSDPEGFLYRGLAFEQKLYGAMAKLFPEKKTHYENREKQLFERMGSMRIIKKM
ncbi:MAG: aldolase/citrate lyase family protein [Leptospirales bacterium]